LVSDSINIGIKIPHKVVTKVQLITAKRDSGKSYTAGVEEEECIKHSLPFVVISGMKAHNGIRSVYKIPILGPVDYNSQEFQPDLNIAVEDARLIAHLIVEQNLSCILYIGNWRKDLQRIFVAEFLDEIFYINNSPRNLYIEEADVFAPQSNASTESKQSRTALDEVVRRGRERGLGVTMITQRPAVLHKDIMTQADLYLIGNFIADQDIKAIHNILSHNGKLSSNELKTLIKKINSFAQGEFLLYSPSWLKKIKTFKVKKRKAFHSGATPEFGEEQEWKALPVNVSHLRKRLELLKDPTKDEIKPKQNDQFENAIKIGTGVAAFIIAMALLFTLT